MRLTPAGGALLLELRPLVEAERKRLFDPLPATDLAVLHRVLDSLMALLS